MKTLLVAFVLRDLPPYVEDFAADVVRVVVVKRHCGW